MRGGAGNQETHLDVVSNWYQMDVNNFTSKMNLKKQLFYNN